MTDRGSRLFLGAVTRAPGGGLELRLGRLRVVLEEPRERRPGIAFYCFAERIEPQGQGQDDRQPELLPTDPAASIFD